MLSRVNKSRICKPFSVPKSTYNRNLLVSRLLENFVEMLICSYCKERGFEFCKVFSGDSSRCIKYIRLDCSKYDVIDSSSEKLCNIAIQH
ncbi:hypothetical protein M406DRAFT_250937 [Cryphonectria parasitica EP155]|uniref:Uncharacterized protein n=1 Tax=Cryphonectria parasitica (strain ATCC 38755 / EP155) TaxID=660469 RepID=A0A9P4Y860_CRYP1|nr:uncharacterized protein M406DRAFT_250937 [Cryphonectria parasitica EP155]KAF3768308.1 hypothetical protein M406DRAFT_250937 [Cryphonectria parasitica EP155]